MAHEPPSRPSGSPSPRRSASSPDLLLPDVDGREIARLERKLADAQGPIVIMITGWDFGPDLPDAEHWGVDHVFLKPLNVAELVAALETMRPHSA